MLLLWLALGLTWVVLVFVVWMQFQILRQAGTMLSRLEALEQRPVASLPEFESGSEYAALGSGTGGAQASGYEGLAIGAPAPAFELPDLEGHVHSLSEW